MTKADLMNGDVVATRWGELGVIIKRDGNDYIIYQHNGKMDIDLYYNDDLTCIEEEADDIMDLYRGGYSFYEIDVDDPMPDWSRDINWQRPMTRERECLEALWEEKRLDRVEEMRQQEEKMRQRAEEKRNSYISIITQCFYGNRTGTEINRDDVKGFIRGWQIPISEDYVRDVELKTIHVPGDKHVIIVYDQTAENEYLNVEFPEYAKEYREKYDEELQMKATCSIPELGIELHTRCFACRIDKNGVFQSLEDGDEDKFIEYFPIR